MSAAALASGRRTMLLVGALLALPFAVAFALYWFEWRPARLGNHGELIEPPQALPESGLTLVDGSPLPTSDLRRKWTLVMVIGSPCTAPCLQDLHQIRQVQVALNKEMVRLRRVLLGSSVAQLRADPALAELQRSYPDLLIAAPDGGESGKPWRTLLNGVGYRFYVIDPLGNVMMRYPEKPEMQGMLRDLERLLKYSWVG
jgi:cytochrome oxidase Cu insertion factor (SCO1/SenC/PrrC family)